MKMTRMIILHDDNHDGENDNDDHVGNDNCDR